MSGWVLFCYQESEPLRPLVRALRVRVNAPERTSLFEGFEIKGMNVASR